MNYQARAFQISFLLHGLILVFAIILSNFMGQYKKVTVVDFELRKPVPEVKKVEPPKPVPIIKPKPIEPKAHQNTTEKEPPRMPEERPQIEPSSEISPLVKLTEARSPESSSMGLGIPEPSKAVKEGSPGISGGSKEGQGTGVGMGKVDGVKEAAKAKYLNDHFAYIRDKILRNVIYPDAARRMVWQGKVILSFIIMADGSVSTFKIIQGSGYSLLDKSAIETVKDTAPFPKPPGEAQIVISIVYRME
jgi:protein TonB